MENSKNCLILKNIHKWKIYDDMDGQTEFYKYIWMIRWLKDIIMLINQDFIFMVS